MSFKERGQREEHGWVGTNNTLDLPMNLKEMICSVTSQGGEKYGQTGGGAVVTVDSKLGHQINHRRSSLAL